MSSAASEAQPSQRRHGRRGRLVVLASGNGSNLAAVLQA